MQWADHILMLVAHSWVGGLQQQHTPVIPQVVEGEIIITFFFGNWRGGGQQCLVLEMWVILHKRIQIILISRAFKLGGVRLWMYVFLDLPNLYKEIIFRSILYGLAAALSLL